MWGSEEKQRIAFYFVAALFTAHKSSQKLFYFHSRSSHPFILLPSSISFLTSSFISRQEDRHEKSLFNPETKQDKLPHQSKQPKIYDNVQGTAQIKEGGDATFIQVLQNTGWPCSSIMLQTEMSKQENLFR